MHTNKRPRRNKDNARRKALADATAGVIGSLVSVLAFYPVDVWKTSLQAGVTSSKDDVTTIRDHDDIVAAAASSSEGEDDNRKAAARPSIQSMLSKLPPLSHLFRGLPLKIAHTIVSSFTYFFVYSLVQTKYDTYRRSLLSSRNPSSSHNANNATPTVTKLLLTAFAAVINTGITLPLDTISSRKQAGTTRDVSGEEEHMMTVSNNEKENGMPSYAQEVDDDTVSEGFGSAHCSLSEEYHSANEEVEEEDDGDDCPSNNEITSLESSAVQKKDPHTPMQRNKATHNALLLFLQRNKKRQLYIKSPEKFNFSFSTNLAQEAFATTTASASTATSRKKNQQLKSILSLWNGLFPAILLCSNPAIQYTMFDTLKSALAQHRWMRDNNTAVATGSRVPTESQGQAPSNNKLSMWEAFLFGLVSKFVATIVTYPLIRCKVMLMVSPPEAFEDENNTTACKEMSSEKEEKCNSSNGTENGHHHHTTTTTQKQQPQRQTTQKSPVSSSQETNKKYPRSLPLLLLHIFREDGIRGIFKGCSLQLLHTILKSAMLMMVREKITSASHRFFQVEDDSYD